MHEQRDHVEKRNQNTHGTAYEFLETSKEKGSGPWLYGGVCRPPSDPAPPERPLPASHCPGAARPRQPRAGLGVKATGRGCGHTARSCRAPEVGPKGEASL